MQIRDLFATQVVERIEPVVKVLDRRPAVVAGELNSLVMTAQWERFLHQVLDAYTNAADRDDEEGIGIWISGFFGSGKSLLMKVLGALLVGGEIGNQRVNDLFLNRLPSTSQDRADLQRFLAICERKLSTAVVGGNLHAEQASAGDPLALIAFKLFAQAMGYSSSWPLAWAVEYQIDRRGRGHDFHRRAEELAGQSWEEIVADTAFYTTALYQAAADTMPDDFKDVAGVERAINTALQEGGITPTALVDRLRTWCVSRDGGGRRQKLLVQLDELGQWIRSGTNSNERIMQVQALVEIAASKGGGRIWLAVTAHGDVQALSQNVQQEQYAKINQRFALRCKLSNDDIGQVVDERLLRKKPAEGRLLATRFAEHAGEVADLGAVANAQRVYPLPTADSFALSYPYLPWTVAVIPDVVRGIAQAAHRGDELTGSTRTLIGVVQGAIIDTPGLLDAPVGRLLALADLYGQLSSDVPIETKTDLSRVAAQVAGATAFTERVARALFLLGEADFIPTSLENVTRAVVDADDMPLAGLRPQVKTELDRLVAAGYAKLVGETYIFLNTQQRGFQDKVRERQAALRDNTYDLSQALREYDSEEALRVDRVAVAGREIAVKLTVDGRVVRNPGAPVTLHVYSPLQRALDPGVAEDAAMSQRANADPNTIYLRMEDQKGLRDALALALATEHEANAVLASQQNTSADQDVARQAKAQDLPSYKDEVKRLLALALRGGVIFFRGTRYALSPAGSTAASVRETLAQPPLLPTIYSRFRELTHRVADEDKAVKAALAGNTGNPDVQALGVYRSDGTLNDSNALLSTLRGRLPLAEKDGGLMLAGELRDELERPPYGWDGNAVKVGLALLLRASACRLAENGKYVTDPTSADAVRLLTKELSFKALRVQGVGGSVDPATLREIRDWMEALFGVKPALVAATIHSELGRALTALGERATTLDEWGGTAQCPLPTGFAAGRQLADELASTSAPVQRLRLFHERAETMQTYCTLLDTLETFRKTQGARFAELRDFYNRMLNVNLEIPALRAFLEGWRVLSREGTITEAPRWREVEASYHAAQRALAEQAAAWRQQTADGLAEVDTRLTEQLQRVGVPPEKLAEERTALEPRLGAVRQRLEAAPADPVAMQAAVIALQALKLEIPTVVREVQTRYYVAPPVNETHLTWQDLLGCARIAGTDDLDAVLYTLRTGIERELAAEKTVVIE